MITRLVPYPPGVGDPSFRRHDGGKDQAAKGNSITIRHRLILGMENEVNYLSAEWSHRSKNAERRKKPLLDEETPVLPKTVISPDGSFVSSYWGLPG
jgi:phosphoribulokinase